METYEKLGGVYLLALALSAGFLAGRSCSGGPASDLSVAAEPATTPTPEVNDLQRKLRAGQAAGSKVAVELAGELSKAMDSFGHKVLVGAHAVRDAVKGAAWEAHLWLVSKGGLRGAASVIAAGGAALARSSPVHLGHNALHAAAAAGWVTRVSQPAAHLVTAGPWVVAAVSLCAALHSLGVLGMFARQTDEAEPPVDDMPSLKPPKMDLSQIILTLEIGMAIGAGSAMFLVWITRQKLAEWVLTRSRFSCPKEDLTPEKEDDAESWPVFTGSKCAETHSRPVVFSKDDANGILSGLKQYLHRKVEGQTAVDVHGSPAGSSRDACPM